MNYKIDRCKNHDDWMKYLYLAMVNYLYFYKTYYRPTNIINVKSLYVWCLFLIRVKPWGATSTK